MSKITTAGVHYDAAGHLALVTQGLGGYTLVARKKILFRLYTAVPAGSCLTVLARITYTLAAFSITRSIVIPSGSLLIDTTDPLGSNIGILFTGDVFPFPSTTGYSVEFDIYGSSSPAHFAFHDLVFLPAGRIRLLIHDLIGTAPWGTKIESDITWLVEMFRALERLSAMMPVRDGIKFGLTHADAGICFTYGEQLDSWPAVCPSGNAPPCTTGEMFQRNMRETREINASGTAERVDATVIWRPRDLAFPAPGGEGVGGKAISYDSPPGTGQAGVVGGNRYGKEFTAAILAQEIGHLFGLEPKESPHVDDPMHPQHSKDPVLNDPFAFDFYHLRPYRPLGGAFLGDVMSGGGVSQGSDMSLYNAFDWEHLRQRLVRIPRVGSSSVRTPRTGKDRQQEIVATLDTVFTGSAIKVKNPAGSLPARDGWSWHWTPRGFQSVAAGAGRKRVPAMAPSAEALRSWLAGLGVAEFHAPVGNDALPMLVDVEARGRLQRENVGGMYWL